MRLAMGGLILAGLVAVQPAKAEGEAAVAGSVPGASTVDALAAIRLPGAAPAIDALVSTALPSAPAVDALVRVTATRAFRISLRLDAVDLSPAAPGQGELPRLRKRIAGSTIDFYPFGDGLRLSAGKRPDLRARAFREAQALTGDAFYAPRATLDLGRFRKAATALTMGYGRTLARGLTLGIEGGMLLENARPAVRELARFVSMGGSSDSRFRATGLYRNPVVQMTMGWRF